MSGFTTPAIGHVFLNADGTYASGAVEFSLLARITNGATSIVPSSLTANLSTAGTFSQAVTSTLDPGTFPTNVQWRIDMRILGASAESWVTSIPPIQTETAGSIVAGSLTTLQLSSLMAATYMFGQSLACAGNIPSGATVTGVNTTANTLTMSTAGTAGTALSVVVGTSIDLGALLPQAQQIN
jgi:hypothetical protein